MGNLLNRVLVGWRQRPLNAIITCGAMYGVMWTFLEPIIGLVGINPAPTESWAKYLFFVISALTVGSIRASAPQKIEMSLGKSFNKVSIEFGDLFLQGGIKVIPASQFMLETDVIQNSLQGKIIDECRKSGEGNQGLNQYYDTLSASLKNIEFTSVQRGSQAEKQYSIGTSIEVKLTNREYVFVAVTKTERQGSITNDNCSVPQLLSAMQEFWDYARYMARGKDIVLPLIGAGAAGVDLSMESILKLHLIALEDSLNRKGKITTGGIKFVIHPQFYDIFNLKDL